MNKILSISIAAYNIERFISETLESVITDPQHLDMLEIIIVNDGSTDSTLNAAREYESRYPDTIVVIDKENGGYGSTVNTAIRNARGKYFKLLDGDDTFNTRNLCKLLDYLSGQTGEEADLIITPWNIAKEGKTTVDFIDKHPQLPEKKTLIEECVFGDGIAMFEVCVRTELLKRSNIALTEHCFYTDNEFVMAVELIVSTVVRFPLPIYIYRLGVEGQSVSIEGRRRHFRDFTRAFRGCCRMYSRCQGEIKGGRKFVTDALISVLMRETYVAYMLQRKPLEYRKELKTFDREINLNYPEIREAASSSRGVQLARRAGNLKYRLLCIYLLNKELKRIN